MRPDAADRLRGVLLGTAVGDALGLPAEGLSPRALAARGWDTVRPRHRFLFRRGMWSDDTEHTFFVARALADHPDDPAAFQRSLAWKLRWWLLGLPAGVGLGTARAVIKLWLGFPPNRAGVRSAGNGPAMRSAVIGAFFAGDAEARRAFVEAATRLTHTDPRALVGALAVAEAAAAAVGWIPVAEGEPPVAVAALLDTLAGLPERPDSEWASLIDALRSALDEGLSTRDFAIHLGLGRGVSGYVYHTVPVALFAFLRHPCDFAAALGEALACGGDSDTVGAIVGAMAGAAAGSGSIPIDWIEGIAEWPRSTATLAAAADELAAVASGRAPAGGVSYPWPGLILRNVFFLGLVLAHAMLRLVPRRAAGTARVECGRKRAN